jgi:hypothetical protein
MGQQMERFLDRWFGGHVTVGPVTVFGRNAMHFAVNIRTRDGWICFKPPTRCFGVWWPWYFYISPDATPQSATTLWGYRGRNGYR